MKFNYNDQLEKVLTAVFGAIGMIAIVMNLHLKGYGLENILDALKDTAGLIVVIAVFLLANKLFRKGQKFNFVEVFEQLLKEWIHQNQFLVCDNFDEEGKGKYQKRYCSMVIDHSNIITRKKYAKDAIPNKEKGAFVYLPYLDESGNIRNEFEFRFNERTFDRQSIYRTPEGGVDIKAILEQFAKRIDDSFGSIGITSKANPGNKTITVSFHNLEQNETNARKLIEVIEFVKTLTLALA